MCRPLTQVDDRSVLVSSVLAALVATAGIVSMPGTAAATTDVAQEDSLARLAAHASDAVVRIDVEAPGGSRQGSGFIVSPDGRVVTNYHVVRNAQSLEIKLASGDVYERAAVLAVDKRRDIAVLQVPGFDLASLPLGNSDSVRVGTDVVAIGSPLGLDNTVATGIVSGRRQEPEGYGLLQISVPSSRGSSGGPVLTRDGTVVGVAVSRMQGGENLNFAVPINYARGLLSHADTASGLSLLGSDQVSGRGEPVDRSSDGRAVNRGLSFRTDSLRGYTVTMEGKADEGRWAKRRVTYRRIEAVGTNVPRIERYEEYEITKRTGPFDTRQTVRRERSRTLVRADNLKPLSVRGETAWWSGDEWRQVDYRLHFDGYRVQGTIQDTTGATREIDRDVPSGVLLRSTRNLAFATLANDSLFGRSVEFTTLDASTGELNRVRYDVRGADTVSVGDRSHPALEVNIATGVTNRTSYFRQDAPRVLLRRRSEGGGAMDVETWTLFGAADNGAGGG